MGVDPGPSAADEHAPPHVLVIDDDPTMCDVVSRYLRREGFAVTSASDGAAGLRDALRLLPDLVEV